MNIEKTKYITGLKGLACLSVMIGHYLNVYTEFFTQKITVLDWIRSSPLSHFLMSPGYWLQLFYVISGYLISKATVTSVSLLIKKSILRTLRFAIPIFFVYMAEYVLYKTIGFHNANTTSLFINIDFQQNYFARDYSFFDFAHGPFQVLIMNNTELNGPYWVVHAMFLSSLYIYLMVYLKQFVKSDGLFFSVQVVVLTVLMVTGKHIYFGCILGMLLSIYEEKLSDSSQSRLFAICVLVAALFRCYLSEFFFDGIFAVLIIIYVPKLPRINSFLSSRPICFLGDISWDIYSFHWPVLCSVGALIMVNTFTGDNLVSSFWLGLLFATLVTMAISLLFYFTFDRWTSSFLYFLKKKMFSSALDQPAGCNTQ